MAKDDLIRLNGVVCDRVGGGVYKVKLENGTILSGRLSGKMKKFKINVVVGDWVTLDVSPYDPTHGILTHRHKHKPDTTFVVDTKEPANS